MSLDYFDDGLHHEDYFDENNTGFDIPFSHSVDSFCVHCGSSMRECLDGVFRCSNFSCDASVEGMSPLDEILSWADVDITKSDYSEDSWQSEEY